MAAAPIRAYLVDDEPLAIERLTRLLAAFETISIAGAATDPAQALAFLNGASKKVDVLFLDIQMPGLTGFDLLARLDAQIAQPFVIFTTAYDEYALRAFEVNSIDYLVKPVDQEQLDRALTKLERLNGPKEDPADLLKRLEAALGAPQLRYPERVASRIGDRILFLDLPRVTHFFAEDKLTFAAVKGRPHIVDHTISDLEQKLDPAKFYRIHRSTLLNLAWVQEMDSLLVRLKDETRTELVIARDRVRGLRERLGL